MKRRSKFSQTFISDKIEISNNGIPLRQMGIEECFHKNKIKNMKLEKPTVVSSVSFTIDSDDSDFCDSRNSFETIINTSLDHNTINNDSVNESNQSSIGKTCKAEKNSSPSSNDNSQATVCINLSINNNSNGTLPNSQDNNKIISSTPIPTIKIIKTNGSLKCTRNCINGKENIPKKSDSPKIKASPKREGEKLKNQPPSKTLKCDGSVSPSKTRGSSTGNLQKIKNLKAKDGQQLQMNQLKELNNLIEVVTSNLHLKRLLNKQEQEILDTFDKMDENTKYVVMKLFLWKRTWYNAFDFCKKGGFIDDNELLILNIFENLKKIDFVDTNYSKLENISELLHVMNVTKIREIMNELRMGTTQIKKTKAENIDTLLRTAERQKVLPFTQHTESYKSVIMEKIENKMGSCFKVKQSICDTIFNVYLLATFPIQHEYDDIQDYFRDIIYNRTVFPEISVECFIVFLTSKHFAEFVGAVKSNKALKQEIDKKNKDNKSGILQIGRDAMFQLKKLKTIKENILFYSETPHLTKFTAERVYVKILTKCTKALFTKRSGFPNEVKEWLEFLIKEFPVSYNTGKWYNTLIALHKQHLKNPDPEMAANLIIEAATIKIINLNETEKQELATKAENLKKLKSIDRKTRDDLIGVMKLANFIDENKFEEIQIDAQLSKGQGTKKGRKCHYTDRSDGETTIREVEQVALDYFKANGYPDGEHCESRLINALFVLFFWDIIYNPAIAGTFISKMQTGPLDIFTEYFYSNRKNLIKQRLKEIASEWSDEQLVKFPTDNWEQHSHKKSIFGPIEDTIEKETIKTVVTVMGRKLLSKIFETLAKNLAEFKSGMPDLLVWNYEKQYCKFVEVKSDNDKLSIKQKIWLNKLQSYGAKVCVCWVHSTGSKRKYVKKIKT